MRTDDALLNSLTTASTVEVRAKREQIKEEKQRKLNELQPQIDAIGEIVATERAAIPTKLWDLINVETSDENTKSAAIALKMYDQHLGSLQALLSNLQLRSKR